MNNIRLVFLALLMVNFLDAQIKAVTENGDEVVLYEEGTWRYLNEDDLEIKEIPLNSRTFQKPNTSTFLLKSNKLNIGIYLNPKNGCLKRQRKI